MAEEKKLFIVEFAEEDADSVWSYCSQKPIHVVAADFSQAAAKAMMYLEWKKENKQKSVLTEDGSLDRKKEEKFRITAVKVAGEEVLW